MLLKTIFACAVAATCAPGNATPTFDPANGHYYDLIPGAYTWTNARAAAQAQTYLGLQGHLATITSSVENAFVNGLGDVQALWLGGYQLPGSQEPAGGWVWITGEAWSYTNWEPGEPNNVNGIEDKLQYHVYGGPGNRHWNDNDDSGGSIGPPGYVVEFEAVPEPSVVIGLAFAAVVVGTRRRKCEA